MFAIRAWHRIHRKTMQCRRNLPWPSIAPAHTCHSHVMIEGNLYRTVHDSSALLDERLKDMEGAA